MRVIHLSLLYLWDRIVSSSVRPVIITDSKGRKGSGGTKRIKKQKKVLIAVAFVLLLFSLFAIVVCEVSYANFLKTRDVAIGTELPMTSRVPEKGVRRETGCWNACSVIVDLWFLLWIFCVANPA